MKLSELSNDQLDIIAAAEVMGWRLEDHEKCGRVYRNREGKIEYVWGSGDWSPTTCRNQSRMVVEAAMAKMEAATAFGKCVNAHMIAECFERAGYLPKICANVEFAYLTPREETLSAILAVRASKGEEPT